jgi:hypothetical protein
MSRCGDVRFWLQPRALRSSPCTPLAPRRVPVASSAGGSPASQRLDLGRTETNTAFFLKPTRMRALIRPLGVALCPLILASCAVPPQKPAVSVQNVASHSAISEASARASAAPDTASTAHGVEPLDRTLIHEGYRAVRRGEKLLYCRTESLTGTAFGTTICLTAADIERDKRNLQHSRDGLSRATPGPCASPKNCGS